MRLDFLSPLYDRPGPWAAVYFDTSEHSESTADKRALEALEVFHRLAGQGADEPTCRAVYDALAEPSAQGAEPPGRALFAMDGEVVLNLPLSRSPGPHRTSWSVLPHTGPLLECTEEDPSCLIAYIDRRGADMELRGPAGGRAAGTVRGAQWPLRKTPSADWSERRNAEDIAQALADCQEESGAELVVLCGSTREVRAVRDRLPARLREHTVESPHGGRSPRSDSRLLEEDVERARAEHARERTARELDRFRAARAPQDGRQRAAEGVPALVDAARRHRIAELFVQPEGPDVYREVWVGAEPDQLSVRRTDALYLGEPHPAPARADDALLRSAVANGAEVVMVPPDATAPDDAPVGGLGALLR
ncbi:hypothetical protein [Streptomyces sp. GC420]|uniref:baeRF2 domain-containing protein n=1 Tax=Streptomyces sp. GC420 TaxID=2697568 RepID=UPI001415208E|nr:hypothetical protein [Streptomyces sp. GC420]NBM18850.1 hypothetical protein [Streptomyces sp. GC420]